MGILQALLGMGQQGPTPMQQPQTQEQAFTPVMQPLLPAAQNNGLVQDILTQRFQPQQQDIARSIFMNSTGLGTNGGITSPELQAEERIKPVLSIAKAMAYANGGRSGSTIQAANQLMAENPSLSFADAYSIAKSGLGQGVTMGANGVAALPGATNTIGNIAYAKKTGGNISDLEYNPQIAKATEIAKVAGTNQSNLQEDISTLPQLESTVNELSKLGKTATYTEAGNLANTIKRQSGLPVGQGAVDRAAYVAMARNQILPLLRRTFGAQFTQKEGETLMETLAAPDLSSPEKDAILNSFIQQKKANIGSLQRQLGQGNSMPQSSPSSDPRIQKARDAGYSDDEINNYLNGQGK